MENVLHLKFDASQEERVNDFFLARTKAYSGSIILELSSVGCLHAEDMEALVSHIEAYKESREASVVVVSEEISYDDLPEWVSLCPTLQEAYDLIEMEAIERDLFNE